MRNYKNRKRGLNNGLSRWFAIQTLIIVGLGVFTSIVVNRIALNFAGYDYFDSFRRMITIGAVILILIIFEILQYRLIKRHLEKICDAISHLSHGEYGYKLKSGKYNIFKELSDDLNLLSEELKNVQILRNDFVNSYSHEFKTPIASINGFAQLLHDDNTIPWETRREYLKIIVEESERLTALAGNTILLSQLDTQKIVADKKPYSLDEQLRRCVIMLSNAWGEKNIEVLGEFKEVAFNGDEDIMANVWLNIIFNAIKFTPEGGKITVSCEKHNGRIWVSVADTGCGMSKETAENIFEKYYQAKTDSTQKGLGLGLAIAYRSVELHGGRIHVQSKLGEGTTFTVELPA